MSINGLSDLTQQQNAVVEIKNVAPGGLTPQPQAGTSAAPLAGLTVFIPTEVLAPFLALVSVAETNQWDALTIYKWFLVITPGLFLLIHYGQIAVSNMPWPSGREIPLLIWKMIAATIAFAAWALISPSNPLQSVVGGTVPAALVSTFISPLLVIGDHIVVRLLRPKAKQDVPSSPTA